MLNLQLSRNAKFSAMLILPSFSTHSYHILNYNRQNAGYDLTWVL